MNPSLPVESRLLLLSPVDNCLVACIDLQTGDEVLIDGLIVALPQPVTLGHKVARHALRRGDKLLRCGAPIGSATHEIARGEHVHMHNLASDYITTYTLEPDRGFIGHAKRDTP